MTHVETGEVTHHMTEVCRLPPRIKDFLICCHSRAKYQPNSNLFCKTLQDLNGAISEVSICKHRETAMMVNNYRIEGRIGTTIEGKGLRERLI